MAGGGPLACRAGGCWGHAGLLDAAVPVGLYAPVRPCAPRRPGASTRRAQRGHVDDAAARCWSGSGCAPGCAAPSRIGPTVTPSPATIFSALKVMLAASRFGMTSRLRLGREPRSGKHPVQERLGQRGVRVHLALDLELGRPFLDQRQGRRASSAPRARRRCRSWNATAGRRAAQPEAADLGRREQRHLGDLLGRRVGVDVGVADEHVCRGSIRRFMAASSFTPSRRPIDLGDVAQMRRVRPEGAAQHAVRPALAHQHGARSACRCGASRPRRSRAPARAGGRGGSRPRRPGRRTPRRRSSRPRTSRPGSSRRPSSLILRRDHLRPADQDGRGQALVHHDLRRAQHAVVLALGVDDAPASPRRRRREHRLHHRARGVDVALQRPAVGLDVRERPRRDAARIAASATAGATVVIRRGSNGAGSGSPGRSGCPAGHRRPRPRPTARPGRARRWRARRRASSPR